MPNPDFRGEFAYLYYQIADYDTTQLEADILADASWIELCVIDADESDDKQLTEVGDRCTGTEKAYSAGKNDFSVSLNMNELRLLPAAVRAFDAALDDGSIIAILKLDSERTDTLTRGVVANCIAESKGKSQPYEDNIGRAITFRLAAKSTFTPLKKRVYGSGVA